MVTMVSKGWACCYEFMVADHITYDEINGMLLHGLVQQREGLLLG